MPLRTLTSAPVQLSQTNRRGVFAATLVAVPLLGWADYATGAEVAFTLLYLLPIAAATWSWGRRHGAAIAFACAVSWIAADIATRWGHFDLFLFLWNLTVESGVFAAFVLLLAALRSALEAERRLARTDPLTGLPNRRAFLDAAGVELERARRQPQPLTLACFDLDGFKAVNDRFGHRKGDGLLCAVATQLREAIRVFDLPVRLGGDEFAVLLPGIDGGSAPHFLERLRSEAMLPAVEAWGVSVSCGAVTFLSPPESIDEMLDRADDLMYKVKRSGKGAVLHEVETGCSSPSGATGA